MRIITKCVLEKEQALDKINKGSNSFEIHTEKKDIDNIYKKLGHYINLIRDLNMDIYVVHSPINCNFDIEDILSNFKKIEDVFFLANEIGKLQNRVIYVVLHMRYDLFTFEKLQVKSKIFAKLKILVDIYKNTNIVIENVMAVDCNKNGLNFRVNSKFEAARFVEEFNLATNSNIGTVLDICHAFSTIELLENYKGLIDDKYILNIDDYIKNFINTLKIVHLANSKNLGLGKGNHGISFESKDEERILEKIIKSLHNIGYDGIITLEIAEDDYLDTKNWVITENNLYKIFDCLNIKYCKGGI